MTIAFIVVIPILLWLLFVLWDRLSHKRAEKELEQVTERPLSAEEIRWVTRHCRLWHVLSTAEKERLGRLCRRFLYETGFEACGDLEKVTLEMQWAIAANACLLLLSGTQPFYNGLLSVLVYPDDFVPERISASGDLEDNEPAIGESTENGNIILSWPDVADCGISPFESTNVVLHEFAHFLDTFVRQDWNVYHESGLLSPSEHFGVISDTLRPFWEHFRETGMGCLDEYAGTNPSEFFAVATEFYFEVPETFSHDYPELYLRMRKVYGELDYMKK